MRIEKVLEGLWRWTSPHPDWTPEADRPNGWARDVGSVYYESHGGIVLIDPLVPAEQAESERFWQALDRDVSRIGRRLTILVGCVEHGRSADAIRERATAAGVEVEVVGAAAIEGRVSCRLTATFETARLPFGIVAHAIGGLSPGETAIWLAVPGALVFADAVVGAGSGKVRVAPASWGARSPEGEAAYAREFRASLARLADLAPEILLPAHGDAVMTGGAQALCYALSGPAWGD